MLRVIIDVHGILYIRISRRSSFNFPRTLFMDNITDWKFLFAFFEHAESYLCSYTRGAVLHP
jgi:hypothetical protein